MLNKLKLFLYSAVARGTVSGAEWHVRAVRAGTRLRGTCFRACENSWRLSGTEDAREIRKEIRKTALAKTNTGSFAKFAWNRIKSLVLNSSNKCTRTRRTHWPDIRRRRIDPALVEGLASLSVRTETRLLPRIVRHGTLGFARGTQDRRITESERYADFCCLHR